MRYTKHPECIRLSGIDCPEKGQAYGHKAKEAASALVFGKNVTLQTHGKDTYGRNLGSSETSWCWWYRKYAPEDAVLEELEKSAREERKGLGG